MYVAEHTCLKSPSLRGDFLKGEICNSLSYTLTTPTLLATCRVDCCGHSLCHHTKVRLVSSSVNWKQ